MLKFYLFLIIINKIQQSARPARHQQFAACASVLQHVTQALAPVSRDITILLWQETL